MKGKIKLMKNRQNIIRTILLTLACFGLSPAARAVSPPPDGGYPGENTAEGNSALFSLTTGHDNTAVGLRALFSVGDGSYNTAVGSEALENNTGDTNTAIGWDALFENATGSGNTAIGSAALNHNTTGIENTAIGGDALNVNRTGSENVAIGVDALFNNRKADNTAIGADALIANTTGQNNVALGYLAGSSLTTGSHNIDIGAGINGIAGESNACRIGSIFGQTAANGSAVFITSGHKLGTAPSSKRFKENINPMNRASEVIFSLKPVAFRYKKEIDPAGTPQLGLVAEEVEKVNPDLVVHDKDGKPYSVRYDQVNAMLLNEFLKEHKKVEEQQATITELKSTVAQQRKEFQAIAADQAKEVKALSVTVKEQASQIQKVSAQIEANRSAPQVVVNR
jgi:hypothetical protein